MNDDDNDGSLLNSEVKDSDQVLKIPKYFTVAWKVRVAQW